MEPNSKPVVRSVAQVVENPIGCSGGGKGVCVVHGDEVLVRRENIAPIRSLNVRNEQRWGRLRQLDVGLLAECPDLQDRWMFRHLDKNDR